MTSLAKKRPKGKQNGTLTVLLTSGGILTTLVGSNLIAGQDWVDSIVPEHTVDQALLDVKPGAVPQLESYGGVDLVLPDVSGLPRPVAAPALNLSERVVLEDGGEVVGTNGSNLNIALPEIPQVAAPVIPQRPQVNVQSVSIELPPIPDVHIPQPVTTSSSSK